MRAIIAAALLALGTAVARADRYGVDEAMREGPDGSGLPILLWSILAGASLGYLVGRAARKRDPSRDPQGYAVLGALIGGPLIALLWVLG